MKPILASTLLVVSLAILNASEASAKPNPPPTGNITGVVRNNSGKVVGSFVGTIDIVEFVLNGAGNIVANAELTGTLVGKGGKTIGTIQDVPATLPLRFIDAIHNEETGLCEILSLNLGPLDLNVLGLIVHLDEVNLDVTADPTGGLLGSLLCALAGIDLGNLVGGLLGLIVDLLGLDEIVALGLLSALLDFLNSLVIL